MPYLESYHYEGRQSNVYFTEHDLNGEHKALSADKISPTNQNNISEAEDSIRQQETSSSQQISKRNSITTQDNLQSTSDVTKKRRSKKKFISCVSVKKLTHCRQS
jgi:hypothetical protein